MRNTHTLRSVTWAAIIASLSACTQPTYYQEGATQAQSNRDSYECLTTATALGGGFYGNGFYTPLADQNIYHRCLVARGWRLRAS